MDKTLRRPLGCSAFCMSVQSRFLVGRNLDVPFVDGYVLTNHRGRKKRSLLETGLDPAVWTSRWGSVTFNLLGPDLPMGGMNERGLMVEHLWMPGTLYPDRRGRPALLEFEWIQFMLDNCSTVAEVLARSEELVIARNRVEMHFLTVDATGASALLEFENGERRVYSGTTFPVPVVTNSWYPESLDYFSRLRDPDGNLRQLPDSLSSLDRFARLAFRLVGDTPVSGDISVTTAFDMLRSVLDSTLLSIVYDPSRGEILYQSRLNPVRRELKLVDFDFSGSSIPQMLDIHREPEHIGPMDRAALARCAAATTAAAPEFLKLDTYLPAIVGVTGNAG